MACHLKQNSISLFMYFDVYTLGRTKSYDFQPTLMRNSGNNKSFTSVQYYRIDSNPEVSTGILPICN